MAENNIICNHQLGFQKGRNTSDAILEFLEYVYSSLNDGKIITPIYLDFNKPFDTVNHGILLSKLEHYGIRGIKQHWHWIDFGLI